MVFKIERTDSCRLEEFLHDFYNGYKDVKYDQLPCEVICDPFISVCFLESQVNLYLGTPYEKRCALNDKYRSIYSKIADHIENCDYCYDYYEKTAQESIGQEYWAEIIQKEDSEREKLMKEMGYSVPKNC